MRVDLALFLSYICRVFSECVPARQSQRWRSVCDENEYEKVGSIREEPTGTLNPGGHFNWRSRTRLIANSDAFRVPGRH
ncbi:hypothetical protein R3P38DRAFT_3021866, partial [Favolaschia claudopus]